MKAMEYVCVIGGADYCLVTYKDNPGLEVGVRRGSVLSQADVERMTPESRRDLDRWLKTGDFVAKPVRPAEV